MKSRRVRAIVKGRVQGVAFRAYTQEHANRLGLGGWVRNRPDGTVEVEAEGDEERLRALIEWLWKGPPAARVDGVQVEWLDGSAQEGDGRFRIRH